ncbi:thiol:disulfide interchange protein DsbA/DsbL [Sulfurivermis fontis]|jgi:thiol:disulfide interchange protein DsbA|uniref:thiol:disulfide interchange protein DsbA/DsbL n=1 Tax=Sulfurivermis fontis TaxID=1972068 RepID=UPI000FD8636A|nr:thiol:disulfide interchange protein DsbA/DsbL [Sulfurivermis fontis]
MKNCLARAGLALLLSLAVLSVHATDEIYEGFQYARLDKPVEPLTSTAGKVEVVELFWYGCGHCYAFEPHLHDWLQRKPDYVEFIRIPAIFNSSAWRLHARAYYTAEVLGIVDKIHGPMFNAIHKDKRSLNTEQQLAAFFAEFGVEEKKFMDTFKSFAVDVKVNRAERLTQRFGIDGVPSVVVAGKYRSDGPMAQSYQGLLQVVDFLVAKERATAKPTSTAAGK